MSSVNNNIPFVPENTIDPAAGLNESISVIDALLQLRVLAVKQNAPPASPSAGDRYIVGTSPTGAWVGHALELATWIPDGYWMFRTAWVAVHGTSMVINTGSDWVPATAGSAVVQWGEIAGSIADQLDLVAALGDKVDKVSGKGLSTEDYTSAEKSKLAGIETGAQVNVATNLAQGTRTATTVPVTSSTGTSATLAAATATLAGVMTSADKAKLDGIAAGAQVNAVTSVAGKTGAVTLAKGDVGLSNVDNTSDANKPISTATATALAGKLDATATAADSSKLGGQLPSYYATAAQGALADTAVQPGDLAPIATSGAAADVSITDAGSYYTSANVEGALQEVGGMIGDIATALDLINGEVI